MEREKKIPSEGRELRKVDVWSMQDESVQMRNLDDGKCLTSFKSYVQVLMLTCCKNIKFTGRKIKTVEWNKVRLSLVCVLTN